MRTEVNDGSAAPVEVTFDDVLGMKVRSSYRELHVVEAEDSAEMDVFLDMPKRYEYGYLNLVVSDGEHSGFIVCGRVRVRQADSDQPL